MPEPVPDETFNNTSYALSEEEGGGGEVPDPVPDKTFNNASDELAEKAASELESSNKPEQVYKQYFEATLNTDPGSLFEASTESITRDATNAGVDPALVKSAYQKMLKTISDRLNADDKPTIESVLADDTLPDTIEGNLSPEEQTAFEKTLKLKGESLNSRLTKSFPKVKDIKADLKLTKDNPSTPAERATADEQIGSAVENVLDKNPSIKRTMAESTAKEDVARAEEGKTPTKGSSIKSMLKFMTALKSLVGIGALIGALLKYCSENTGCMKIYTDSEGIQQKQKIFCHNNNSFAPQNCDCVTGDPKSIKVNDDTQCADGTTLPEDTGNTVCKNKDNFDSNDYIYYSYQVMDPLDALPDFVNKVVKLPEDAAGGLLKILKKVAMGVVILAVLYIIFKLIMTRKNKRKS
jgi:hypothetical protein